MMQRPWFSLDKFKRYQNGLFVEFLNPKVDGKCGFCGNESKKRWCSKECSNHAVTQMWIIKGDIRVIRKQLFLVDKGACRECGEITKDWEADHILPVHQGGGACGLDNFQTLCKNCHKEKTFKLASVIPTSGQNTHYAQSN